MKETCENCVKCLQTYKAGISEKTKLFGNFPDRRPRIRTQAKKVLLIMMCIILSPIGVMAAEQSDEVVQNGKIIAFDPAIESVTAQRTSMVVNIDTVSCAYLYQVQWSDRADFQTSENRFFRNVDNRGGMMVDKKLVRQNGILYNTRTVWYGGYRLSFRKMQKKEWKNVFIK